MKRNGWLVTGLVMLGLLVTAGPAAAAEKIGFVNVQEALVTSTAGKRASEDFKKLFEKEKAAIQEKEGELKKLKDELEKQRSLLKEEVFREKEQSYQKKFRDYQLLVKDSNEELQAKDQDLSKKLLPEVLKIIQGIGEKEKYTMIIDISMVPFPYYNKEQDLTKRVVEEFNRTYKPRK